MRHINMFFVPLVSTVFVSQCFGRNLPLPAIIHRQDPAAFATSSYDYWWPYGPGGIYATTTSNPVPVPSPAPTPTQSNPMSLLLLSIGLPTDSTASTSSAPTSSTQDSMSTSSPTDSDSSATSNSTDTTSSVSATTTTTASPTPSQYNVRTKQLKDQDYLIPVFAVVALVVGVVLGFLIRKCRSDRPHDEEAADKERLWEASNVTAEHSPGFWSGLTGLLRRKPSKDSFIVKSVSLNGRLVEKSAYGYGQWKDASVARHISAADMTRIHTNEDDAEEIDLTGDWRHYSSMYSGSPDVQEPGTPKSKRHKRSLSRIAIPQDDDKFTALPGAPPSSPSKAKTPRTSKVATLLNLPWFGRKPVANVFPEEIQPTSVAHHPIFPERPRNVSIVRSRKGDQSYSRDAERSAEDDSFVSLGSHPISFDLLASEVLSVRDNVAGDPWEDELDPAFTSTPRYKSGSIRHASIRRMLATKVKDSPPSRQMQEELSLLVDSSSCLVEEGLDRRPSQATQGTTFTLPQWNVEFSPAMEQGPVNVSESREERRRLKKQSPSKSVPAKSKRMSALGNNYRRTQQPIKDEASTSMIRGDTQASTIPSIYSPESGLWTARSDDEDPFLSAAELARASRRSSKAKQGRSQVGNSEPLEKAQSPLPDLPSRVTSPPLEAELLFSPPPPTLTSPPKRSLTASTQSTPPSHFTPTVRAKANQRVESVIRQSYAAKAEAGAAGGFGPVIGKGVGSGIEQRLAMLRGLE